MLSPEGLAKYIAINIIVCNSNNLEEDNVRLRPIVLAGAALIGAGCSNVPPADQTAKSESAAVRPAPAPSAAVRQVTQESARETDAQRLGRMMAPLASRSVHFSYDGFSVGRDQDAVVQAHVGVLRAVATALVTLEGNADERGSREYNLALGQKRADAVAQVLKLNGIDPGRVETVSFGEERPRAECHAEQCWADNRRVDFRYRLRK